MAWWFIPVVVDLIVYGVTGKDILGHISSAVAPYVGVDVMQVVEDTIADGIGAVVDVFNGGLNDADYEYFDSWFSYFEEFVTTAMDWMAETTGWMEAMEEWAEAVSINLAYLQIMGVITILLVVFVLYINWTTPKRVEKRLMK